MQTFTGYEYLLIDIANQFGLDKKLFEERIQWATEHLDELESFTTKADKPALYIKAVMALRKAQKGIPTGHRVGFDAVCSGVQVMSVLTGCIAGATATGLVDPNVRADAYSTVTNEMNKILGSTVNVSRQQAKDAVMTSMYGSKAKPKEIFGEDTPELNAFYEAVQKVAPGAWELLQDLLASWKPYALSHEWKMPDGFDAKVKVMTKVETRVEVDELDHATFTYEYYENEGQKKGLSNVANVVHSFDAYVLRCIYRRCNYDAYMVHETSKLINETLLNDGYGDKDSMIDLSGKVSYYIEQYERSGMADVVILPYLDFLNICGLSKQHLEELTEITKRMLQYAPFEVVAIHDEFTCHANNMNHLRQQYINIMAELADSNALSDVLGQLIGTTITYNKLSNNLSSYIRQSNYALS